MSRKLQKLALITVIVASAIGYLARLPSSDGIEQIQKVRFLSAFFKLNHLVCQFGERFGFWDRIPIKRSLLEIMKHIKDPEEDKGVQILDTKLENVPVRIVRPLNNNEKLPAVVYYHGGAYYMGSIDSHNGITSRLSRLANVVVISVDYRLAPEHPFPAGLEDCDKVTNYVLQHGDSTELNIDVNRVALAGDSAGGNFAAVISMRYTKKPKDTIKPKLQVLLYPVLQLFDLMLPSYLEDPIRMIYYTIGHALRNYLNKNIDESVYANNHTSIEQKKKYRKYVDWSLLPADSKKVYKTPLVNDHEGDPILIKNAELALSPEISPLLVEDEELAKLPPTYVLTVGHDPLRDEGLIYVNRLRRLGLPLVHNHYPHTFHGSLNFLYGPLGLNVGRQMVDDTAAYLREYL